MDLPLPHVTKREMFTIKIKGSTEVERIAFVF